jgi:hypothetical protein
MAQSVQIPQGIVDLVKSDGVAREITGVIVDGTTPTGTGQYMVYLDEGVAQSVPLAGWPAVQATLAQKEADKQQAAQVKAQIIQTFAPMVGRLVTASFTARELQAWLVVVTHKLGGVGRGGELLAPGEWKP